jgi:hypothetical protein
MVAFQTFLHQGQEMKKKIPYFFSSLIANILKTAFMTGVIAFVSCILFSYYGLPGWLKFGVILIAFDMIRVVWGKSGPVWWFIEILVWRGPMEYGTSPRRVFSLIALLWTASLFVYKEPTQIEFSSEFKKQYPSFGTCSMTIDQLQKKQKQIELATDLCAAKEQPQAAFWQKLGKLFEGCQIRIDESNYRLSASEKREIAKEKEAARIACKALDWKLGDAISLSLRYHVPMFSLDAKSDYTLKDTGEVKINLPFGVAFDLPFNAAEYGALMKLFNFLLWPIAIALFIRWAIVGQSQ